jgi:hypothetical protein
VAASPLALDSVTQDAASRVAGPPHHRFDLEECLQCAMASSVSEASGAQQKQKLKPKWVLCAYG